MNCVEAIDLMGEALDCRLSPANLSGFEQHMTECASCGTYFEQLRLTRDGLRSMPSIPIANPRREELLQLFRREFERKDRR